MSADKDRAVRRQKQKRAKDRKRALRRASPAGTPPVETSQPAAAESAAA